MGRAPCCDKTNVKRGPWSPEEDAKLKEYIEKNGTGGNWIALPQKVGLRRCGKSCRLRWLNYLRPNIKHGEFSEEEDRIICNFFATIGSRWSIIAGQLPGRTDNDIKNYWNTKLKKKFIGNMAQSTQNYQKIKPNINQAITYPLSPNMPLSYDQYGNYTNFRVLSRVYDQPISPTFTPLISSNSKTAHDGMLSPFHGNHNQLDQKDSKNFIFGGDQTSCSTSSEGSTYTTNNQNISPDYNNKYHDLCFQSYLSNGVDEFNQKLLFSTSDGYSSAAAANGCTVSDQNQLDYIIEEIKQLSSTNNICNNLNFFVDEIRQKIFSE